jgi:hypothetical protein
LLQQFLLFSALALTSVDEAVPKLEWLATATDSVTTQSSELPTPPRLLATNALVRFGMSQTFVWRINNESMAASLHSHQRLSSLGTSGHPTSAEGNANAPFVRMIQAASLAID